MEYHVLASGSKGNSIFIYDQQKIEVTGNEYTDSQEIVELVKDNFIQNLIN